MKKEMSAQELTNLAKLAPTKLKNYILSSTTKTKIKVYEEAVVITKDKKGEPVEEIETKLIYNDYAYKVLDILYDRLEYYVRMFKAVDKRRLEVWICETNELSESS